MPEHRISYSTTKTYSTLNLLTDKTENIWLVCLGLGYLSRYFIKYFSILNPEKNYIIAPQAPSKYYQDQSFKRIGASWLTREETQLEMQNIKAYFDAIYQKEIQPFSDKKLIVLGYSQGVSVAMRWVAQSKINCEKLLMHSGGIPVELKAENFKDLRFKPYLIYGKSDPYITKDRAKQEVQKAENLFGNRCKVKTFDGTHEINQEILKSFDG
ncbi:alpha/beta hydrolase [Flavobacterium sp. CS20]|uniref:alpha/beta hydrolase n=1 Tax=Flavobacterium sp. CS20 TaxID=2775246 RepID=UPI001B39E27B|nr:esterase [Flavobacterium sp. CS20]QTY26975.1 esterase [Flavobacterium sp. CS20]